MRTSASEDLDALARLIFGEARGESLDGQIGVGWVVRNRMARGSRFGYTIPEVARRPAQFSCFNPDDPNYPALLAANLEQRAFLQCLGVAALVLSGALPDPTVGADHYHAVSMPTAPHWASSMTPTVTIGGHRFFRETVTA